MVITLHRVVVTKSKSHRYTLAKLSGVNMKIEGENYKGIEFIQISSLPEDQKTKITATFRKHRIIKILKEKELLSDCVQYVDYAEWYSKTYNTSERDMQKSSFKSHISIPNFKRKKVLR